MGVTVEIHKVAKRNPFEENTTLHLVLILTRSIGCCKAPLALSVGVDSKQTRTHLVLPTQIGYSHKWAGGRG